MAEIQKPSGSEGDKRNNSPSKSGAVQRKRGRPPKLFRKKASSSSSPPHHDDHKRSHNYQDITCNPQKRRKRLSVVSVYDNNNASEAQLSAYQRAAKMVEHSLSPQFPSLVKCMLPSHVTGGFWLGLPKKFCDSHLPIVDSTIALEDENGQLYQTKYLAKKMGLSGGWRGFSIAHNLHQMDVLIFHLVQPSKFKVYIIRSQGSDEMSGALGLLKLNDCTEQIDEVEVAIDAMEGNDPDNRGPIFCANLSLSDHPENENTSGDFGSEEVYDGIRFPESAISFKEVTCIENFRIIVNGLVIDSELPKHVQQVL